MNRNIIIHFLKELKRAILWRYLNFGYIIKHISPKGATKNWEHFASNLQVSPYCIVYGTCKYTNWTLANKLTWRQCQARGFFSELKVSKSRKEKNLVFSYPKRTKMLYDIFFLASESGRIKKMKLLYCVKHHQISILSFVLTTF